MRWLLAWVLLCGVAAGQAVEVISPELAKERRDYETIRRMERDRQINGPAPWEKWCIAQLENGVVTKIIDKPANAQKLIVGPKFLELHSHQRDQLIGWLCQTQLQPTVKKPVPVPIYLAKPDGKPGKRIGTMMPDKIDYKLTVKAKPDDDGVLTDGRLYAVPAKK